MQNKFKMLTLTLFTSLSLAACGSGSSGGGDNSKPQNNAKQATLFDNQYLENIASVEPKNNNEIDKIDDELDKILVLDNSGFSKSSFNTNEASYTVYAVNLADSAYSVMVSENRPQNFARLDTAGINTSAEEAKMLSGTATYTGKALLVDQNHTVDTNGSVKLQADFTNKNISGEIKGNNVNIALNKAQIVTETNVDDPTDKILAFQGNATTQNGLTGQYEGHFMGKNAKEVVGIATLEKDNEKLGAAFGATKQ
ncbi:hypothetical protein QV08_08975 [Gallibacterium salpingitidis]|uniref:factor H binding protein domain-containing protein n=1 Tax=Gallibacterium salpingitidis TaxID=505341 RepID=UPI0008048BB0|nr:factor H binding protein domain-containing protein [Gallibacterium salpingitidis]OBX06856.1 hypothetical protein QV08_08975 [Gallibacterium salpingitidis]